MYIVCVVYYTYMSKWQQIIKTKSAARERYFVVLVIGYSVCCRAYLRSPNYRELQISVSLLHLVQNFTTTSELDKSLDMYNKH